MTQYIRPGSVWNDSTGSRIEAHGGTMYIEGDTYYWLGEDKSHTTKEGKIWTWGIKMYASKDLYTWQDLGHIIEPSEDVDSLWYPERKLDRPHLIKCSQTGKYILWVKFSGDDADYAVLESEQVTGPYTLVHSHLQPYGHRCGDFDLYVDEDEKAYLYFEADHTQILVSALNETYTDVDGEAKVIYEGLNPPLSREGPAHFKYHGKHYLITSGMSGYVPNPSETAVSLSPMGPYEVQGDPCINDDSSATFNSQISCIFKVIGKDECVMMADRWVPETVMTKEKYDVMLRAVQAHFDPRIHVSDAEKKMLMGLPMLASADTSKAVYVWLPIHSEQDKIKIEWQETWQI